MKKLLAFALAILALAACQNDTTKLLNAIDGRWQVNTAIYSGGSGLDSVATFKTTYLAFDHCSSSTNGSGPSNCNVQYLTNNDQFRFTYQAPHEGETLYISPTNEMKDPSYRTVANQITGSYQIETLTDKLLVMRRAIQATGSGYRYVQFSSTK